MEGYLFARILSLTLIVWLLAGCSMERRYAVLSFFFDGVPAPGAGDEKGRKVSSQYFPEPSTFYVTKLNMTLHAPFQKGECTRCHPKERSLYLELNTSKGLCYSCHEHGPFKAKLAGYAFVHGPVAVESCAACHDPHESVNSRLLVEKDPKLCYECHDKKSILSSAAHGKLSDENCLPCHDPHGGMNRFFLKSKEKG